MARQDHSYNSGRIHRAGAQQQPARGRAQKPPPKPKKKKGCAKKAAVALLLVLAIGAGALFGLWRFVGGLLDKGDFGSINVEYKTKAKGVTNILLVGIDYEQGRTHTLTDMIMYINYDIDNNKMNMLQFPRDIYVGTDYSVDGKINSAMSTGADKENPIDNLAKAISEQYQLPIDCYIALDMESMRAIVDSLGPIYVYVPKEMSYGGSYLPPGWTWMDGEVAEFFVRNRMGPGFERADIDRLDNQRYFYSALFRRFLNLSTDDIGEASNLIHIVREYVNTDLTVTKMVSLALAALDLEVEDILMAKMPGATGVSGYGNNYVVDLYGRGDEENIGAAELMNRYFRNGDVVTAEELAAGPVAYKDRIPESIALYPPNIQQMGEIQAEEGGADIDVEPVA